MSELKKLVQKQNEVAELENQKRSYVDNLTNLGYQVYKTQQNLVNLNEELNRNSQGQNSQNLEQVYEHFNMQQNMLRCYIDEITVKFSLEINCINTEIDQIQTKMRKENMGWD